MYRRLRVFIGWMTVPTWFDPDRHYSSITIGKVQHAVDCRPWPGLRTVFPKIFGDYQSFADQLDDITKRQLFPPPRLDLAVDRDFARLDSDFCFAAGSHQSATLDEVVQSNHRSWLIIHYLLSFSTSVDNQFQPATHRVDDRRISEPQRSL